MALRPIPVRVDEKRRPPSEPPQPEAKSLLVSFIESTGLKSEALKTLRAGDASKTFSLIQKLSQGSPLQQLAIALKYGL